MKPHIGIHDNHLAESAQILSKLLADEYLLYTKTRNAHWNIEGADFYNKHLFFEAQYNELDELIDSLAERIRNLGHYAPASLNQFLALTQLTEHKRSGNDSAGYIKELLMDHESIIVSLRENIDHFAITLKDIGTSDYATGLLETHEKMAWMLRAHLS
ncbi:MULTISPECIES: Dps family protein [Sphingobacterium]|uniref:Dps family protein n=1 Tax=Sphingobacterium TaxID=28453 RepID=UPI0006279A50|nr:DNA starvation/stationary phase protection protein [Sphingobacterium sp. Ag1]KKO90707.1 Dps family ferritin [Sphingobacterium sp. Ag1]